MGVSLIGNCYQKSGFSSKMSFWLGRRGATIDLRSRVIHFTDATITFQGKTHTGLNNSSSKYPFSKIVL